MKEIKNYGRTFRLIEKSINLFGLRLDNLIVLTEAASGYYSLTPIIAAMAGAKKVFAITNDSRYAPKEEVKRTTDGLAKRAKVDGKIEVIFEKRPGIIRQADIITNLGFVRPINKEMIGYMKKTAVIPLMFETWEYREEDLNLAECRRKEIAVLGTNERAKELEIFGYIGYLAMKLAFELDIEVFRSKIAVIGGGYFGENTVSAFTNAGAEVINFRMAEGDKLFDERVKNELTDCDLIIFVEHQSRDLIFGEGGQLTTSELLEINPGISIVHIAGEVDKESIVKAQIPCRPAQLASSGYMSVATDYLGPRPIIDLHTAGLKVGELLVRARLRGLSRREAESEVLKNPVGQGFSEEQKKIGDKE